MFLHVIKDKGITYTSSYHLTTLFRQVHTFLSSVFVHMQFKVRVKSQFSKS